MRCWMRWRRGRAMTGSHSEKCYRVQYRDGHGRTRMPQDRISCTIEFNLPAPPTPLDGCERCREQPDAYREIDGSVVIGLYPCGCIGEIFIKVGREGEMVRGLLDAFATMFSIALQHGAPLDVLLGKMINASFQPAGFTQDPRHPMAKSILDYIGVLLARFAGISRSPGEAIRPNAMILGLREGYDGGTDYNIAHPARM